jgi:hydrogenase/urease accessory protein HupE
MRALDGIGLAGAATVLLIGMSGVAHAHAGALQPEPPPLSAYFGIGVEHILCGFDHLVFLLGVVLIAVRTREVLFSVTAFTLAHSITLALAVLGLVEVSPRLVEPLIALSVAYVGLENFFSPAAKSRHRLTFAFGLVHGLGFAGALQELGMPSDRVGPALALFNLGVESGQLLVLLALWPLLLWLRRSPRGYVITARALNIALITLGTAWALERTLNAEPAAATAPSPAAENVESPMVPTETEAVRSVYAADPPHSELATELCTAVQRLPRQRRAACSGTAPGLTLERECSRVLGAALASPALRVDAAAADRCI